MNHDLLVALVMSWVWLYVSGKKLHACMYVCMRLQLCIVHDGSMSV